MFSQLAKQSARLLAHNSQATLSVACRGMSVDGVRAMQDRETAAENLYFNKEEERLLRGLLAKMKNQADKHDNAAESHNTEEGKKLEGIVSKYKLSEEDFQALLKWKHS